MTATPTAPVHPGLFTDATDEPHLVGGRCRECTRHHFPVLPGCPYCAAAPEAIERVELPRRGTLWGWTSVTAPPPGYTGEVPFGFGVVELPVGMRVITRLTEADPSQLEFGQEMEVVTVPLHTRDDGTVVVTYAFAPLGDNGTVRGGAR